MRRLFTTEDARARGVTMAALRWQEHTGVCTRIERGVYGDGPEPPTPLDRERARVLASGREARGALAGVLLGLDAVDLDGHPTRKARRTSSLVIDGIPCADAAQALVDLAATLDDARWEQALESALRRGLLTIADVDMALERAHAARAPGAPRMERVLGGRPDGAPPTGSLLETLALQMARGVPLLGEMTRQHEVRSPSGAFVARVDLSKPEIGLFFELDGQQHKDQPVYDARRQTAVVAVTGWLPGRFTWHEVVRVPRSTRRRMEEVAEQAARRWAA